jgi:hypothetical protein
MKKDFSQPFVSKDTMLVATLIVRESITRKYVLLSSSEQYEEDFYSLLSFDIDPKEQMSQQLGRYLYSKGILVGSYMELASKTGLGFSFIDDTPGTERVNRSLFVEADIPNIETVSSEGVVASLVTLDELIKDIQRSPYMSEVDITSLAVLKLKEELFNA